MVMVLEIIATACGDDVEVVVPAGPHTSRGDERAVERIVGIVHAIHAEDGFQAVFVKSLVVGYEGQTCYLGLYLLPYVGEDGCVFSVFPAEAVDAGATPVVVVRLGVDERVERVDHLAVFTITTPTAQTLVRSKLAVSKSMAAKSFMVVDLCREKARESFPPAVYLLLGQSNGLAQSWMRFTIMSSILWRMKLSAVIMTISRRGSGRAKGRTSRF